MAFSLTLQDKLALMMTLFASQRRLADALGVSHQRVGRWLREGEPAVIDPETGDQLKSPGIKKIPDDAGHLINGLFQVYKQITKDQARADGIFYDSRIPVFINRPRMDNGQLGLRIYAEHTQYIRQLVRINYFALAQRTEHFVQASMRSEINIFSYIGSTPKESIRKRQKRYEKAEFQNSAESIIQAGGRLMPVYTKYENISPGTSTGLVIKNLEAKLERHSPHATKLGDMWLFQLRSAPSNEISSPKRVIQRSKRRGAGRKR